MEQVKRKSTSWCYAEKEGRCIYTVSRINVKQFTKELEELMNDCTDCEACKEVVDAILEK